MCVCAYNESTTVTSILFLTAEICVLRFHVFLCVYAYLCVYMQSCAYSSMVRIISICYFSSIIIKIVLTPFEIWPSPIVVFAFLYSLHPETVNSLQIAAAFRKSQGTSTCGISRNGQYRHRVIRTRWSLRPDKALGLCWLQELRLERTQAVILNFNHIKMSLKVSSFEVCSVTDWRRKTFVEGNPLSVSAGV